MRLKKAAVLLMAGVLTLGSVTGCGSKTKDAATTGKDGKGQADTATVDGKTKYPRNEQGYPDLGGETITIWHKMTTLNSQAAGNLGEYKAIKEVEEKFNVKFEFIHPPVGQEKDNFTIMMADGKLPDMIFCGGVDLYYPGGVETALADGVLYDYTPYINEEYTPNFYNLIKDDEFLKKAVTDDSQRIIRLGAKICGSEEADLQFVGPLIRKDYLEATGLDVPKTIDDWTNLLKALKENGIEYPIAFEKEKAYLLNNTFASAFGISASAENYYVKDDGKVAYGPAEDGYKDYLTLLNSWYKAGYINPDFTTQTADEVMSMMSADRVGSTLVHLYTYGVTYFVTTETADPDKALVPAPVPVLKEGDKLNGLRNSSRTLGDYKYITADAENKEACIALLDALYLEDIDRLLANGIEGAAYEMEDGVPVAITLPSDASKDLLLSDEPQQWHTSEDTDLNYILTKKYNKGAQADSLKLWKEQGSENMISNFILFNSEEAEIKRSYEADVKTYVEEMTLKFIMGVEPLENFSSYQENLKNLHIDELIGSNQKAMDRYNAR